ncbi:hypothetical protein MMC30_007124 [Trapelia coarctata]|nr:hypothetical protein [Trapelia coarctata]
MGNRTFYQITALLLLLHLTCAIPWAGPAPTPTGLMAEVGMSPWPTEAPGLNGIPKELLRRQQVPFPPPLNWCGFVNGDPNDPLSCYETKTCVYSGAVMGCCDAGLIATCENIYTTCLNSAELGSCGAACQSNFNVLKCSFPASRYCGTYNFAAGTRLYNCQSLPNQVSSVEFLADYYITQLSITLDGLIPTIGASQTLSSFNRPVATTIVVTASGSESTDSSSTISTTTSSSSLSLGTIIGIAVGAGGGILAIIGGLIAFCCIRRRNRKRRAMPYNPAGIALPVEHHFPKVEKPTFGSQYVSVPQNEQHHDQGQIGGGINKAFDPMREGKMPSSPAPSHPPPPFSSVDRKSLGSSLTPEHRFSAAPTVSSVSEQGGQGQAQYQQIHHPSISEVDGDIYRGAPSQHVTEVEAVSPPLNHGYEMENTTQSHRGHGAVHEMGSGMQATSNGPRFDGPYEMEHQRYAQ